MECDRPSLNHFCSFLKIFLLLVCELFREHEMCSQLEVTKMLECKVNLTVQQALVFLSVSIYNIMPFNIDVGVVIIDNHHHLRRGGGGGDSSKSSMIVM